MNICITGGSGFIGSALIRHVLEKTNFDIINVDKLTYAGNNESLSSVEDLDGYKFERVDICDSKKLIRIFHMFNNPK